MSLMVFTRQNRRKVGQPTKEDCYVEGTDSMIVKL